MKRRPQRHASLRLEPLEDRMCPTAGAVHAATGPSPAVESFGRLPLAFEANVGQTDAAVDFLARGPGYATFLGPTEAVLSIAAGTAKDVVRLQVLGGNPRAAAAGLDELPGHTNYLLGKDASRW